MKLHLILAAAAATLALVGCDGSKPSETKATPEAAKPVDAKPEVRAPAPPPPPGGGKPAPEIPPEVLAKIRAELAKNPPPAPAPAPAAPAATPK